MTNKTNDARCNGSCADATQVRATRLHRVQVQGRLNEIRIAEMSDGQFLVCCTDYFKAIGAIETSKVAVIRNSVMLRIDGAEMKRPMVFAPFSSIRAIARNHKNRVYRERGTEVVKFLDATLKRLKTEQDERMMKQHQQQNASNVQEGGNGSKELSLNDLSRIVNGINTVREQYSEACVAFNKATDEINDYINEQNRMLVYMGNNVRLLLDEVKRLRNENDRIKNTRLEMVRYDDGCFNFTQVSNLLGLERVTDLTNSLIYLDVLTRDAETKLIPTADYKDKGYFGYRSFRVDDPNTGQKYGKNLVCTQEGKDFIFANKTLILDAVGEWKHRQPQVGDGRNSNNYGRAAI